MVVTMLSKKIWICAVVLLLITSVVPVLADNSYVKLIVDGSTSDVKKNDNQQVTISIDTDYVISSFPQISGPNYFVAIFKDPNPDTLEGGTQFWTCSDTPCSPITDSDSEKNHTYIAKILDPNDNKAIVAKSLPVTVTWSGTAILPPVAGSFVKLMLAEGSTSTVVDDNQEITLIATTDYPICEGSTTCRIMYISEKSNHLNYQCTSQRCSTTDSDSEKELTYFAYIIDPNQNNRIIIVSSTVTVKWKSLSLPNSQPPLPNPQPPKAGWCKRTSDWLKAAGSAMSLAGNGWAVWKVPGGIASLTGNAIGLFDPPDSNFMVIAQPKVPEVPPVAAQGEVTPELAGAWNDHLNNLAQVNSVAMAMLTSNERAQGAADAGDTYWQTKQNEAAAGYASQLASLLAAQPGLRANLRDAWQASGIPDTTITADDFRKYQADVAANGLPADFTDILTQMGADSTTIEQIRQNIIAQNPDDVAGSVMGKLTDPALDSATQDAVQALNEIAASNLPAPSETIWSSTGTATEVATETSPAPPAPIIGNPGTQETPMVTKTQQSAPGFDMPEAIVALVILIAGTMRKQKKR
jgi:hypothetical protein